MIKSKINTKNLKVVNHEDGGGYLTNAFMMCKNDLVDENKIHFTTKDGINVICSYTYTDKPYQVWTNTENKNKKNHKCVAKFEFMFQLKSWIKDNVLW